MRYKGPLLVIHGEQDFRVPVGEGVRLWLDPSRRGVEYALVYIADENHWVLKPGNVRVWHDAVLRWLDDRLVVSANDTDEDNDGTRSPVRPDVV